MGGVLHLIPQLSGGGGGRSALVAAIAVREASGRSQTIASVRPASPTMASGARAAEIELIDSPPQRELHEAIAASDLVQLHLWNSPELVELLESDLPPCRLLVWPHVAGHTPPHVIEPALIEGATLAVATSTRSADVIARMSGGVPPEMIPPVPGWDRVEGVTRSSSGGFNVGYIGTVGMIRLHPDFVQMSAGARIPEARFIVCGDGDAARSLPRRAEEIGVAERFDFRGHVSRIGDALAEFDVFGYPIRPGTSASSDLNLKEAMYAGVPPLVLADGGTDELVEDGVTGSVAATPEDYSRALERLHGDPGERRRLGANARAHAAERWSPSAIGPLWAECHERALALPRRGGPLLDPPDPELSPGVDGFLRGLGEHAGDFMTSLRGTEEERIEAERRIESCPLAVAITDGGLMDYRRRFPDDPTLALWTGLALRGVGRPVLAEAELHRARQLGAPA
jgi:glycosyltransferase involved in cell wall biosynthesis